MTTLNIDLPQQNKKKVVFINFTNTKRLQWNKFR
ncbi:hypothetical protein MNBD_BACTEROID04-1644, partial [hydrothermal vent metagenome]